MIAIKNPMNVPKLFLSVFSVSLLASVVWLQQSSSTAPSAPDLSSAPRVATHQTAQANPISARLDDADRHSLESQVRRDQFAAEPDSGGALRARNQAQQMALSFASDGIGVFQAETEVPTAGLSQVSMTLRGYVYDGSMMSVTPVTPVADKNRIEYRRGDLLEWYVNDERGLEQGFTLMQRPAPTGIGSPSPRGEGQGERSVGQSKRVGVVGSVVSPHPSPLPRGEGVDIFRRGRERSYGWESVFPLLGERVRVRGKGALGKASAWEWSGASFPLTPALSPGERE